MDPVPTWQDAFGKQVAVTTNEADLAGHYPFSPERFRVFVNGERQFVQYDTVPEHNDLVGAHELIPQTAGDVVTMETAERCDAARLQNHEP